MILQPGQKPEFPTPFEPASPTTPATYVPWFPAWELVSDEFESTFQPETVWPVKSASPAVFRPVSRIATTIVGLPFVMSHACVVCVWYQPQAPPPRAYCCGKYGSFGRLSCGCSVPSTSANATSAFPRRRASAVAAGPGTLSTYTPMSGIECSSLAETPASAAARAA